MEFSGLAGHLAGRADHVLPLGSELLLADVEGDHGVGVRGDDLGPIADEVRVDVDEGLGFFVDHFGRPLRPLERVALLLDLPAHSPVQNPAEPELLHSRQIKQFKKYLNFFSR